MNIFKYDTLVSTNSEAMLLAEKGVPDFSIVICEEQTAGRGQAGNRWESETGKNLTFSIILNSPFCNNYEELFLFSKCISLAIHCTLSSYIDGVRIKWPNDIYVRDKKIAGILIEHSFTGDKLDYSIIGVGLNVNQMNFISDAPNPTSIVLETGKYIDKWNILNAIIGYFKEYYNQLKLENIQLIERGYFDFLYRKEGYYPYQIPSGEHFMAKIVQVLNSGKLVLFDTKKQERSFFFKEVVFLM